MFETPFTQSGKSHADDVSQQFKRKTILTVAGSFPSMLTRLPVLRKRDVIVTPIENAIEDINKRNVHIATEVNRIPLNPKTLTQVLQGSALPQVNEGALSICKIFLNPELPQPREHVRMLCDSLFEFLNHIRDGLSKNKQIITTDHDKHFHFEMEAGFKQLEAEIKEYISKAHLERTDPDQSSESGLTEQDDDTTDDSEATTPRGRRNRASPALASLSVTGRKRTNTTLPLTDSYPRRKEKTESPLISPRATTPKMPKLPAHKKPPPPAIPPPK